MEATYNVLRFIHVLGVVLFLGNLIVIAMWTAGTGRSGDLTTVAFAQRAVTRGNWRFTLPGIILVIIGGYGMAAIRRFPMHGLPWLEWGQALFWISVLIWLIVLVPTQRRLVSVSEAALTSGALGPEFATLSRRSAMWRGIAALLLLIVLYLMTTKA